MRKTKIICTLGPATDSEEMLRQMIEAGMNVARFNFSHGSYDEHLRRLNMLRKVREEMNQPIAALLDTKGPEIRLRDFAEGKVFLKKGSRFTLTTRAVEGKEETDCVLDSLEKALKGDNESLNTDYTRGHFRRGVI